MAPPPRRLTGPEIAALVPRAKDRAAWGQAVADALAGKLFEVHSLTELNPIPTAGPMQVSVRFAEDWAREHHGQTATVRDSLYTRQGGVYYGTARLFVHQAGYSRMLFRFADYNAG